MDKRPAVFVAISEKKCDECGVELYRGEFFWPQKENLLCLDCADLGGLDFLGSGDAAFTRRACKHSGVVYVVLKWSKARKRYERQGVLVTPAAIEQAADECEQDEDARAARRAVEAVRREGQDLAFVKRFASAIRAQFPGCPSGREMEIAAHACLKHSGRIGRMASAKELEAQPIRLAVVAHIRHRETDYDDLLWKLGDREEARARISERLEQVLAKWRESKTVSNGA